MEIIIDSLEGNQLNTGLQMALSKRLLSAGVAAILMASALRSLYVFGIYKDIAYNTKLGMPFLLLSVLLFLLAIPWLLSAFSLLPKRTWATTLLYMTLIVGFPACLYIQICS